MKYVKAADLLLLVMIILYNVCPKPYLLSVILLLSEVVYCCLAVLGVLAKLLSKPCNLPSELQKGHHFYSEEFSVLFFFFFNWVILGIYNKGLLVMPKLVQLNKCFLGFLLWSADVSTCVVWIGKTLLMQQNERCCSSCVTAFWGRGRKRQVSFPYSGVSLKHSLSRLSWLTLPRHYKRKETKQNRKTEECLFSTFIWNSRN